MVTGYVVLRVEPKMRHSSSESCSDSRPRKYMRTPRPTAETNVLRNVNVRILPELWKELLLNMNEVGQEGE